MIFFHIYFFFLVDLFRILEIPFHILQEIFFFFRFILLFYFHILKYFLIRSVVSDVGVVLVFRWHMVLVPRTELLPLTTIVMVVCLLLTLGVLLWLFVVLLGSGRLLLLGLLRGCVVLLRLLCSGVTLRLLRSVPVSVVYFSSLLVTEHVICLIDWLEHLLIALTCIWMRFLG
jgi:hypothetical protein